MISRSILDCIGNTPLIKMSIEFRGQVYPIYAKLEMMNPSGSVKDRIAKHIVEQAESKGLLKTGFTIVEATSGNTGIALSMTAASKGYKMLVVMPEHMTGERIKIMTALGADVCLTPKKNGFEGAVEKADKITSYDDGYFLADQFRNPDNTMAHYSTTGKEILEQFGGRIDAFVAGVGTGGTLMGVGKALREKNPNVMLVAVEAEEAAVLSGKEKMSDHKIAGIGDGFVPEIVNRSMIDRIIAVESDAAVEMAKKLAREHGLLVGLSSGANVLASILILDQIGKEKNIVTLLPDRTERYFSTDLYSMNRGQVRQCSKHCECRFEVQASNRLREWNQNRRSRMSPAESETKANLRKWFSSHSQAHLSDNPQSHP